MTEQEEVEALIIELQARPDAWFFADGSYNLESAAREILNLRKQEIYLEGQNADLRKRVAELEDAISLVYSRGVADGITEGKLRK